MSSLDSFTMSLHESHRTQVLLEKTRAFKIHEMSMSDIVDELKKVRSNKNIDALIDAEKIFVEIDMAKDNSKERISSLNHGLQRMSEAKNSLDVVQNYDAYVNCIKTTSSKMLDKEGLPKDSFRQAIAGQVTSLMNDAKSENSKTRLAVLRERIANLGEADKLYKVLQREHVERYKIQ